MSLTAQQRTAIEARGNTLVEAGAGSGKTGTLVERCINLILRSDPLVPITRVLVVTFTDAAAAEVRERIRQRLDKAAEAEPNNVWIQQQIANLDASNISTLHSFCLSLIREYFYELDLDPAVAIMPAEQAEVLFRITFEELMTEHYKGEHPFSAELQNILRTQFNGWAERLLDLLRKIHHYTQSRPDPDLWFSKQFQQLRANNGSQQWHVWYREAVQRWCASWHPFLSSLPAENENAHHCCDLLKKACASGDLQVVQAVLERQECWPKRKKTEHSAAFKDLFTEADFLDSLQSPEAIDEDWTWSCRTLEVILLFAQQFTERFTAAKRDRGVVDFHDLEQCALRLLWDSARNAPTPIAERWRSRLDAVFVDEYQDINAAQDRIVSAVSHEGTGNRFLVGDIKQSIYRFRQADPTIFRGYIGVPSGWTRTSLSENFRSHEGILNFINPLFTWLMRDHVGGVNYDENARLRFGAPAKRPQMAANPGTEPPVELNILINSRSEPESSGDENENEPAIENAEKEARLVAMRLRALRESGYEIYHRKEGQTRKVEWKDMVVLLRAASGKLEIYAKVFEAAGVPLQTKRSGFFTTPEVLDVLNVLTLLDNPLQDIPLVAVLRSPLVGMTANELAEVRIHAGKGSFWEAVNRFLERKVDSPARLKIEHFLEQFHHWRNPRTTISLAQRIEAILADTGYGAWLLGRPRGRQRYANVQQLLRIARQFDEARGESLYLFLRHIQELQDAAGDIEPAAFTEENAVRLMTVHQSKGLEFPVVAVAGLGNNFNTSDRSSSVILHDHFGLCATIYPPNGGRPYPSLPLWLASQQEMNETLGEEIRVFYVALTRAENLLLLFGSTTESRIEKWPSIASTDPFLQTFRRMRSALDWIGCFANCTSPQWLTPNGDANLPFRVRTYSAPPAMEKTASKAAESFDPAAVGLLHERISITYPHSEATLHSAKTSVSALRANAAERDEESHVFQPAGELPASGIGETARLRGVATHAFLQHHDPTGAIDAGHLRSQAQDLRERAILSSESLELIDFEGIAGFWKSPVGMEIRAHERHLLRELQFTFKLTGSDVSTAGLNNELTIPAGEFVVVQGVADLVLLRESEIWLIDFKTDNVEEADLEKRSASYRAQLALYSLALERIYAKRVTRAGLYFIAPRKFVWLR